MLFALICTDKPDAFAIRKENRPDHLAFLEGLGDMLIFAGPFTDEDGQVMTGSLIVIDAVSLEEAREIANGDPYAKAGLFASVDIRPWLWTIDNTDANDEEE